MRTCWAPVVAMMAATAFFLAGCANPAGTTHAVHLGHAESQSVDVAMKVGQRLTILDGEFNASVGDGWTVVGEPDSAILAFDGDNVILDNPGAAGSGGSYSLEYTAVGVGTTTITIEYSYRGDAKFESVVRATVD